MRYLMESGLVIVMSIVERHHIYKIVWNRSVGEELPYEREWEWQRKIPIQGGGVAKGHPHQPCATGEISRLSSCPTPTLLDTYI